MVPDDCAESLAQAKPQGRSRWLPATLGLALLSAFSFGCQSDPSRPKLLSGNPASPLPVESCATPNEGCACATAGDTVACGSTESSTGNDVICLEGQRTCTGGRWSACSNQRRVKKYAPRSGGLRLQALAESPVPCMDACDPSCMEFADTPEGLDAGPGFSVNQGGLTLSAETGGGSCGLQVSPSLVPVSISDLSMRPLARVRLHASCARDGTAVSPSWTLDPKDVDLATVDANGVVTLHAPAARDIRVTAVNASSMASAVIQVRIDVRQVDPACAAAEAEFEAEPRGVADPGTTLYPYAVAKRPVLFPLGLSAPVLQWTTGGTDADCVKISLRYPAGSDSPSFVWSTIVTGKDGHDPKLGPVDRSQPAFPIDQMAWSAFDRSAAADRAEIVLARRAASGDRAVMAPHSIPVRFAEDALRGTVYYTQYQRRFRDDANAADDFSRPWTAVCGASVFGRQPDLNLDAPEFQTAAANGCVGGNCSGSGPVCPVGDCTRVDEYGAANLQTLNLGIPGATPVDPYAATPWAKCPVCHSVSADGKTLVGNDQATAQIETIASIGTMDDAPIANPIADAPTFSWSRTRADNLGMPEQEQSNGLAYAALTPDGRYALSGPNFWGNTSFDASIGDGNQRDASYPAGGKRFFLLDLQRQRPNVHVATTGALPAHTGSARRLTASANGPLIVDGMGLAGTHLLLVKDEPVASENGVYVVRTAGTFISRWVLDRTSDADGPGELAFGQRIRVEEGDHNQGKYFHLASPSSGAITPGVTPIQFALYTTVMAATSRSLPEYRVDNSGGVTVLTGQSGALQPEWVDEVPIARNMSVLVKDERGEAAKYNGIYYLENPGQSPWVLARREEAASDQDFSPNLRVRVNQGTRAGGLTFVLESAGPITLDLTPLDFVQDTALDEGLKYARGGSPTTLPTMMYPVFSPDGNSLVYVNGDADPVGSDQTGWRRGLTLLRFDSSQTLFSEKRRILNTYSPTTPGTVIKWPFFEPDSRSVVYVETSPDEFCPREAYAGLCSGPDCATASAATRPSIDTDLERACFQAQSALGYGNSGPTVRGYFPGRLAAVDTGSLEQSALGFLNGGLGSQSPDYAADATKSFQPSVLPYTAGGYRWVVFTSTRAYGNQINALGTHFSCAAPLLWMAALDDTPASSSDRSYPAFLLPGQSLRSILDPTSSRHFISERGYLVRSPCKSEGVACSSNEDCCGGEGDNPQSECRIDAEADPPGRRCQPADACKTAGNSCSASSDCCANAPCVDGVCIQANNHSTQVFQRPFEGSCPNGYRTRWGRFQWHADAPSSSRIDFSVQTSDTANFAGTRQLPVASANSLNQNPPPNKANLVSVGDLLAAQNLVSRPHLLVTMVFHPSADGFVAPVLFDWTQQYDCIASE